MHSSPTGWSIATIADVSDIGPKKAQLDSTPDTEFNFVPMPAVREEFGGIDVSTLRSYSEVKKGYTQFQEGDVLFAKITPCMENGKVAVVPKLDNAVGYGSTEFHVLRPADSLSPKWLAYYLSQTGFRRDAQRSMTGSAGQLRVSKRWLSEQTIPVPPIPTQDEILAKIEELFSDLDAGVAALERARANLKWYRASVLKAAVQGKLTEQWRAEHPDVEPASALLERILAERRKKWEEEQLGRYEAKGNKPPKGWEKEYQSPPAPDLKKLRSLPSGWTWAGTEQLTAPGRSVMYGIIKPGPDTPGGVPYVRVMEMKTGTIDVDVLKRCNPKRAAKFARATLRGGDLLVSKDGTIGRVAIVPPELEGGNITQHVIRVSPSVHVNVKYLARAIEAPGCQAWMKGETKGVALQGVNVQDFRIMPIPLPPLDEQAVISERVEEMISVADHADEVMTAAVRRSQSLRASILRRAFAGQLTSEARVSSDNLAMSSA